MIGKHIGKFLLESDDPFIVTADNVATVRTENNLLHALTILSTLGYSSIPVLDMEGKLKGQVTLADIISGIKAIPTYDWESLQTRTVSEVMNASPGYVYNDSELEDVLNQLVSHNYVAVIDKTGCFMGIVTRKMLLRRINKLAHEFESHYDVIEKIKTTNGRSDEAKKKERPSLLAFAYPH